MKYDVFISFKNLDEFGNKTKDAKIAEEIYQKLYENQISTFFSNIILLEKGAAAYKHAIEEALEDAKVLITVATDKAYLQSEWVTYERESFHNDILSGRKKNASIVPFLENITGSDIPRSLRNYQTFQISSHTIDEVVSFVKNILYTNLNIEHGNVQNEELSLTTGKHLSNYSSGLTTEMKRLKIQAKNTHSVDEHAISYVLNKMNKKPIYILDMGCAHGFVTKDRFSSIENARVIAIDYNEQVIAYAKEHNSFPNGHYAVLNLEADDFEDKLEQLMTDEGIDKFDLIFSSLVIHHLKNPNKLLRRVRRFLNKDGFIILRGSDDGSIMTYNDDGLIDKILDIHLNCDGISDRKNGRKIYAQLIASGYKNIQMMSEIKDISGLDLDERNEIFLERFSYRRNYLKALCDKDPYNKANQKNLEQLDYLLSELENKFSDESFWYCEIDFLGIAQKK